MWRRTSPPRKRIWSGNRDLSAAWPTWPCRVWRTSPPSTLQLNNFIIGVAETSNPEYLGPNNTKHTPFIYSVEQETLYAQFVQVQKEFQIDMAEPVTNVARIAAGAFTDSRDKSGRRSSPGSGSQTPRLPQPLPGFSPPHVRR